MAILIPAFPRNHSSGVDVRIGRAVVGNADYLAPAKDQAEMVLYCVALMTARTGQIPCALMTTPSLLDVMVADTNGRRADYTEGCHGLLARGRNKQLGRKDSLFTCGHPDETIMLSPAQTIAQLAKLYCMPIELALVERLRHWEGAQIMPDDWGKPLTAPRPAAFDQSRTTLPDIVEIVPMPPLCLLQAYGIEGARSRVNAAIAARAAELNATRLARTGSSRVLGRNAANRLNPLGCRDPRQTPTPRPSFAGSPAQVAAAVTEEKLRRDFYALCRETFRHRQDVVFPAGTVLFRKLGAKCDPLPPCTRRPEFRYLDNPPPAP